MLIGLGARFGVIPSASQNAVTLQARVWVCGRRVCGIENAQAVRTSRSALSAVVGTAGLTRRRPSALLFNIFGAWRRLMPRTRVDLKVPEDTPRRDLSDAALRFDLALGVHRRHAPKILLRIDPRSGSSAACEHPEAGGWAEYETMADGLAPLDLVIVDGVRRENCSIF